jgi:hypothetical protein
MTAEPIIFLDVCPAVLVGYPVGVPGFRSGRLVEIDKIISVHAFARLRGQERNIGVRGFLCPEFQPGVPMLRAARATVTGGLAAILIGSAILTEAYGIAVAYSKPAAGHSAEVFAALTQTIRVCLCQRYRAGVQASLQAFAGIRYVRTIHAGGTLEYALVLRRICRRALWRLGYYEII